MEKDSVTITIKLDRNVNGSVQREVKVTGQGFHFFELIGLLHIVAYEFADKSKESAEQMPKDKPVKLVFGEPEKH